MRKILTIPALLAILVITAPGYALERVTLLNGFEMRCHHHVQDGEKTRLYLNNGEENFIELNTGEIGSFEKLPDPVPGIESGTWADQQKSTPPAIALSAEDLNEMLGRAGKAHNLDADLLASVVRAESGGNTRAISRTGARGLMQLMPSTAATMGVQDSFQPDQNVRGGSAYLDSLLLRYHDNLALALAAYNAGPAAVDKYHGIPPYAETRAYVARVIHEFNRRVLAREAATRHTTASR